jgi:hypothetical protein
MTRSWVAGSNRLEEAEDVFRAGGGPESQKLVIRVLESPTTADRYEARIPNSVHGVITCPRIDTDRYPTVCQPIYD